MFVQLKVIGNFHIGTCFSKLNALFLSPLLDKTAIPFLVCCGWGLCHQALRSLDLKSTLVHARKLDKLVFGPTVLLGQCCASSWTPSQLTHYTSTVSQEREQEKPKWKHVCQHKHSLISERKSDVKSDSHQLPELTGAQLVSEQQLPSKPMPSKHNLKLLSVHLEEREMTKFCFTVWPKQEVYPIIGQHPEIRDLSNQNKDTLYVWHLGLWNM